LFTRIILIQRTSKTIFSSSKLFIKQILKQLLESQDAHKINLTGQKQRIFKINRSTSALSIELLSEIARALNNEDVVLQAKVRSLTKLAC
jgi:hypothetical protein